MALLNFPVDPDNGDIYPQSPFPGQVQYQWDAANRTWRLLGSSTGVTGGTYGDAYNVGQFTVDSAGRITFAQNIPIESSEGTVTEIQTGVGLSGGPITSTGTVSLNVSYTDGRYLQKAGGTMTGNIIFAAGQTFPGVVSRVNTGVGLTGGPITSIGTVSLDTAYTDGRYLKLTGGSLTGPLRLPNGTISSPALTFASGPFTGFYYEPATNTINVARNGTLDLTIGGDETTTFSNVIIPDGVSADFAGVLNFFQPNGQARFYTNNGNYVGFQGPVTAAGNVVWRLPNADGAAGQVLATNGSGQLSWGPTGLSTLQAVTTAGNTTTNPITANTVTTTGDFEVSRGGSPVAVISDTGSFVPSLSIAGLNYPTVDGSPGDVLSTDGAGVLSWIPAPANNLQAVTDVGATTTNTVTVAGIIAAGLTYPTADGTSGQVLTTDGSGSLYWGVQAGGGTVTSILTDGGITGGPIASTGTVSLTNTGVSPASYTYASITVDEKGRITVASDGAAPNTTVTSPITNVGTATAPIIGIQDATTGQLGAVMVGTNIDVAAGVISVKSSSLTQSGIVQLNDTVASTSKTEALTANQGKNLQDQISTLMVTSNLTLAGTFDAANSDMLTVTADGTAKSFVVGNDLPAAVAGNLDYFVIVTAPGNYSPPGGGGPYDASQGDWFLSNGSSWQYFNVGSDLPTASAGTAGIVELADVAETQTGTSTILAITPAGAAATYLPISSFTAKGALLSASGANTPLALPVGSDNQILTACAAAATGLCWVTPPTPVAAIPCSVLTAKGSIVAATGANTPAQVVVGVDNQILVACSAATTGLCWVAPPAPAIPLSVLNAKGSLVVATGVCTPVGLPVGTNGQVLFACSTDPTGLCWAGIPQATPTSPGLIYGRADLGSGGLGFRALCSLTTGTFNAGIVEDAGCSLTTGCGNIAIGQLALSLATSANDNVAIGKCAGRSNTVSGNIFIGNSAGACFTSGPNAVIIGERAAECATTADNTTALGWNALPVATGSGNLGIGFRAGCNITTGLGNVAIGNGSTVGDGTLSNQLALGNTAVSWLRGDGTGSLCTYAGFTIKGTGAVGPANIANCDTYFYQDGSFGPTLSFGNTFGGGKGYIIFRTNAASIGCIIANGTTAVSYLTTSDYRLKENVKDIEGATEVLRALPVREYNFIAEPEVTRQGFLAHELQEFVPQAVSGKKNEVDDEGNPKFQGVDASQVVPLLVAALKESIARIDALEKKVAELGG